MALEKSVLNIEIIKELLRNYYDLNIISTQKLCLGTANCYRVADAKHSYFLKEFQSGFTQEDLLREAKLVTLLAEYDLPKDMAEDWVNAFSTEKGAAHLIIKAENREELLQFAFWRTEMCRQIELKASEISEELMKLNK